MVAYLLEQIMQRLKMRNHAIRVMICEVETRCLFKTFVPHLVPQNSHTYEFLTYNKSLAVNPINTTFG